MKRVMVTTINSCYDCRLLRCHDGFADHIYECPVMNKWSSRAGDPSSQKIVDKELKQWFTKCPKWDIVSSQ